MSDDLVTRLTEGRTAGTSLRWTVTDIHREAATALAAKDAEIARLRGIINDLIDAAENDRRRAQRKGEKP